ncbi:MAG TPA: DUF5671 domain-containing protein [Candidatus Saccharimonadales bacterium]|nr:DUF5671 domain-containing protein [Candidatus Saccharimonadales bacterium]
MVKRSWVPDYKLPVWAMRSKYYLMEFIAALGGLLVTTVILDRVLFGITRYLADSQGTRSVGDQLNLWAVAFLIVALPVTLLFYKRSRFEELERPAVATTKLRRFFLYIFMLAMLAGSVLFAVYALYTLLSALLGATEIGDALLQQTLPAALAAGLNGFVFRSLMRVDSPTHIKEFAVLYGGIGVVLLVALLVMTSVQARSSLVDEKTSNDLQTVSAQVEEYYSQKGQLPNNLSDLTLDKSLLRRGEKHGYTFSKRSAQSYRLCATFKSKRTDAINADVTPAPLKRSTLIPTETNFTVHDAGNYCFTINAGVGAVPYTDGYPPTTPDASSDSTNSTLQDQSTGAY